MEKLIELQLNKLYEQRGALINQITRLDENAMQYFAASQEIKQHVANIDQEINNVMLRAENTLKK